MLRIIASLLFYLVIFSNSLLASPNTIEIQFLGLNDFHGYLEASAGSLGQIQGTPAGGIEYLATHINKLREGHQYSVTVSAGDLIGASPLLSALFHDEPTIEAMNILGLDFNAVGNHELDDGLMELKRLQNGEGDFAGAQFQFLSANMVDEQTGKTIFPSFAIKEFGHIKIAFVGVVLEGASEIVLPSAIQGLKFLDEADAVNALVPEIQKQGAQNIVLLIHEGGYPSGGYNECPAISGPIVDIVNRLDESVKIVFSGHTHQAYNCVINKRIVTSAASYGRIVTSVNAQFDIQSGEMINAQSDNMIITQNVIKDTNQTKLITLYKERAAPIANRVVGSITANLMRQPNDVGESTLGNLIADAQLEATEGYETGNAVVAFVNPGGVRADVIYPSSDAMEGDGKVTFAELFSVQPFGNNLITMTLKGSDIILALEQQFPGCGSSKTRILHVSRGFHYRYLKNAPVCQKVDIASVTIWGQRLDVTASYRVTANNFIADGGDGFSAFKNATERLGGTVDMQAAEMYFTKHSPISPSIFGRIVVK